MINARIVVPEEKKVDVFEGLMMGGEIGEPSSISPGKNENEVVAVYRDLSVGPDYFIRRAMSLGACNASPFWTE